MSQEHNHYSYSGPCYMKILSIALVLVLVAIAGCKEDDPPLNTVINPGKEQNIPGWFYSAYITGNRYIHIHLPGDYNPGNTQEYHAVYLLDGSWYFDGSHWRIDSGGVAGIMERDGIRDAILVGIGNKNEYGENTRGLDFHSYKTEDFLKFITLDLIPAIDKQYNTDTSNATGRTLTGHSSGAYFTMYAFFYYDPPHLNPFRNFIAMSGDYVKDISNLHQKESDLFQVHGSNFEMNKSLFLAVGELEEDRFLSGYRMMNDSLSLRSYQDLNLGDRQYNDHGHSSYIKAGFSDGLDFVLYGP